ncbi:hypothetical protein KC946_03785 [Candidatus Saccharibacteria bacterium]|nr:hypothetical protein [Candidatus Saccharibacteria bacterium]
MPEEYLESGNFQQYPIGSDQGQTEETELSLEHEQTSRISNGIRSGVVALEVLPFTNGPLRYGVVFGSALAVTGNSLVAASALGASTALLEGSAAIASSSLLTSNKATKTINRLNSELDRPWLQKYLHSEKKLSPPVQSVVGLYAGTSILLTLKQRENPERSKEDLRKYGLVATAALTALCTVQGVAIAEGITNVTDTRVVGLSALTLGGMYAGARYLKNKIKKEKESIPTEDEE